MRRAFLPGLLAILIVAAVLRVAGASRHLPLVLPPEDPAAVLWDARLGVAVDGLAPVAGGLSSVLLAALDAAQFGGAVASGVDRETYEIARAVDPTGFWTGARWLTALAAVIGIGFVAFETRRRSSARAGLIAAALLSLSMLHVSESRLVTGLVITSFAAFGAVALLARGGRIAATSGVVLAALALRGAAPVVVFLAPLVMLRGEGAGRRRRALALAAGAAVLVDPLGLFRPAAWSFLASPSADGLGAWTDAMLGGLGPAGLAVALLGAGLGLVRRDAGLAPHARGSLAVLAAGLVTVPPSVAVLVALPSLAMLAAFALEDLASRVPDRGGRFLLVAAVLAVVAEPAVESWRSVRRDLGPDTRAEAVEWLGGRWEHRDVVLVEWDPQVDSTSLVPVDDLKRSLRDRAERIEGREPGRAAHWRHRAEGLEPPLPELRGVAAGDPWPTLPEAQAAGVRWVILAPERMGLDGRSSSDDRRAFYEALLNDLGAELQVMFESDGSGRGPRLEIWRLR